MTACLALLASSASTITQAHTGSRYCTSTAYLGIGFSPVGSSNAQAPANFCQQGRNGLAGSEGFQAELGEARLAGGFVVNVVDDPVLRACDTEEMSELIADHQPDCGVAADRLRTGVFILAHLASRVGYRLQRLLEKERSKVLWFTRSNQIYIVISNQ